MCSTTIIEFPSTLSVRNVLQKLLFHGQEYRRAAAGPLSYCFGMATSGEPSTWSPLGKLEGQEPLYYFRENLEFSKNHPIFQLLPKSGMERTLEFQSHFQTLIPFLLTSMCSSQQLWRFTHTFREQWSSETTLPRPRVPSCSRPFWSAYLLFRYYGNER